MYYLRSNAGRWIWGRDQGSEEAQEATTERRARRSDQLSEHMLPSFGISAWRNSSELVAVNYYAAINVLSVQTLNTSVELSPSSSYVPICLWVDTVRVLLFITSKPPCHQAELEIYKKECSVLLSLGSFCVLVSCSIRSVERVTPKLSLRLHELLYLVLFTCVWHAKIH